MFYSNFVPKILRFWDIRLRNTLWPWNPGRRSLKVVGTDTDRSATYDFLIVLLTFHSNHLPISHRFWDKRQFQSKITNFPCHPVYFASPMKGFPWNWVSALWVKKLEWWRYRAEQEVWRYLQPYGYNPLTWRMDGQTDTGRQQRPCLCIALWG